MSPNPLHHPDYVVFIDLLRSVRAELGITQVQLAERLGIDQSTVSKIERGERRVDIAELRRIVNALGISFIEFISRLENNLDHTGRARNDG